MPIALGARNHLTLGSAGLAFAALPFTAVLLAFAVLLKSQQLAEDKDDHSKGEATMIIKVAFKVDVRSVGDDLAVADLNVLILTQAKGVTKLTVGSKQLNT